MKPSRLFLPFIFFYLYNSFIIIIIIRLFYSFFTLYRIRFLYRKSINCYLFLVYTFRFNYIKRNFFPTIISFRPIILIMFYLHPIKVLAASLWKCRNDRLYIFSTGLFITINLKIQLCLMYFKKKRERRREGFGVEKK